MYVKGRGLITILLPPGAPLFFFFERCANLKLFFSVTEDSLHWQRKKKKKKTSVTMLMLPTIAMVTNVNLYFNAAIVIKK